MMHSRLALLAVAIAPLAIAAPNPLTATGNCAFDNCVGYSAISACPDEADLQDLKCVCSTQQYLFFTIYVACASVFGCSQSDTTQAISNAGDACKTAGFIVDTDSYLTGSVPSYVPTITSTIPTSYTSLSMNPFDQKLNGGSTNSPVSSADDDDSSSSGSSGLATGAIIGIVVGCIAALAIAAGLTIFFVKHHAKQKLLALQVAAPAPAPSDPPPPISQFTSPAPGQGFFPVPAPPYPPQQQPLMQDHYGQQIGQYGNGFFAPNEKPVATTGAPPPTSTTPAPQELPAQGSPVPQGHTQPRDNVYAEMAGDTQRK